MSCKSLPVPDRTLLSKIARLWEEGIGGEPRTGGSWLDQVQSYTQTTLGHLRAKLKKLSSQAADSREFEKLRQDVDILDHCIELLIGAVQPQE